MEECGTWTPINALLMLIAIIVIIIISSICSLGPTGGAVLGMMFAPIL